MTIGLNPAAMQACPVSKVIAADRYRHEVRQMNRHEKINYIEFPASNITATKSFFGDAFDWSFEDYYGPEYAAFAGQGIDGGFCKSELAVWSDA